MYQGLRTQFIALSTLIAPPPVLSQFALHDHAASAQPAPTCDNELDILAGEYIQTVFGDPHCLSLESITAELRDLSIINPVHCRVFEKLLPTLCLMVQESLCGLEEQGGTWHARQLSDSFRLLEVMSEALHIYMQNDLVPDDSKHTAREIFSHSAARVFIEHGSELAARIAELEILGLADAGAALSVRGDSLTLRTFWLRNLRCAFVLVPELRQQYLECTRGTPECLEGTPAARALLYRSYGLLAADPALRQELFSLLYLGIRNEDDARLLYDGVGFLMANLFSSDFFASLNTAISPQELKQRYEALVRDAAAGQREAEKRSALDACLYTFIRHATRGDEWPVLIGKIETLSDRMAVPHTKRNCSVALCGMGAALSELQASIPTYPRMPLPLGYVLVQLEEVYERAALVERSTLHDRISAIHAFGCSIRNLISRFEGEPLSIEQLADVLVSVLESEHASLQSQIDAAKALSERCQALAAHFPFPCARSEERHISTHINDSVYTNGARRSNTSVPLVAERRGLRHLLYSAKHRQLLGVTSVHDNEIESIADAYGIYMQASFMLAVAERLVNSSLNPSFLSSIEHANGNLQRTELVQLLDKLNLFEGIPEDEHALRDCEAQHFRNVIMSRKAAHDLRWQPHEQRVRQLLEVAQVKSFLPPVSDR